MKTLLEYLLTKNNANKMSPAVYDIIDMIGKSSEAVQRYYEPAVSAMKNCVKQNEASDKLFSMLLDMIERDGFELVKKQGDDSGYFDMDNEQHQFNKASKTICFLKFGKTDSSIAITINDFTKNTMFNILMASDRIELYYGHEENDDKYMYDVERGTLDWDRLVNSDKLEDTDIKKTIDEINKRLQ